MKLTYDIALAKAPTEPGDYELATNTKAVKEPQTTHTKKGSRHKTTTCDFMEPATRLELVTPALRERRSTN